MAALGLSCSTQHLLLCRTGFCLVVARGLSSCGAQAPEHTGSVVAVHGLSSCRVQAQLPHTCGILVLRPGIEATSPALEGGFSTTGPPGKSLFPFFIQVFVVINFPLNTALVLITWILACSVLKYLYFCYINLNIHIEP